MTIFTEITPNPATIKFVVADQVFLHTGTLDFPSPDSVGKQSGLASKLFELKFVSGVMVGFNFITVTKDAAYKWDEVIPPVKELMKAYIASGQPVAIAPENKVVLEGEVSQDSEIVQRIKSILEDNVRPAVAMDGGDIEFDSFEEGIVRLKMKGACSGCPSSAMTLKMGIEGLLTRFIPEVKSVEAV